ncbi:S8 family serine peptidase [Fodinicola feengrottensis]|uniref:S8 family serine peptidase n=1 Tax=Fodinicola feengrottensis TaxID=435914 RepID=UPI0013D24537|nr:S8 family serine peptidase [Fodinicola feengrottensis]
MVEHADVMSESYGYTQAPGRYSLFYGANDAAVAAGVTVVVSSGDSGVSGTVSSPATDPQVIAVGATNTLRLNAQAYGYDNWINNDITPLSSGGTAPNNRVVDLVAPGYGGEAACSPAGTDCPTNTLTEAFGGTSQSCPLVSGAVADIIQAYADSHGGAKPTPALIKQVLTSTAQDVGAPADLQGAGLLNVYAAVRAAQQVPGGAANNTSDSSSLVASTSQIAVTGEAGTSSAQQVSLYNTGSQPARVAGTYRALDTASQLGNTVTEPVSAPDPSLPVPAAGAQAAAPITFTVPAGLDRLNADLVIPDPTNSTILSFTLIDPKGRLAQISYDYGKVVAARPGTFGTVPNIQHVEVAAPTKGTWTVKVLWANGRSHLQELPNVPGSYRGNVSFRATGQHYTTAKASAPVTIPSHGSVTVPLNVKLPSAPGDHPESVQFAGSNGGQTSLPVLRRTLIPTNGGSFKTTITSSVGRGVGQISTYNLDVPTGKNELDVTFSTPLTRASTTRCRST